MEKTLFWEEERKCNPELRNRAVQVQVQVQSFLENGPWFKWFSSFSRVSKPLSSRFRSYGISIEPPALGIINKGDEAAQPSLVSYQRAFSTAVPCGRRCRALERGALHTLRRTPADRRRQVLLCRTRTRQVRQRRGRSGVVVAAASSHRVMAN